MTSRRPAALACAALAAGGVLASSVPAQAAMRAADASAGVSVAVNPDVTFIARGAQAYLALRVSCPRHSTAFVGAQLSQRAGDGLAVGFGGTTVACAGEPRRVTLVITPGPGGKPFHRGVAATAASLGVDVPGRPFLELRVDGPVQLRPR